MLFISNVSTTLTKSFDITVIFLDPVGNLDISERKMASMTCNLLPLLDNDIVVLTANRRITNRLQQDFAKSQAEKNHFAFPTPNIFPLNNWLCDFYLSHHPQPKRILSEVACDLLWRDIINAAPHPDWILPSYQTAKLAKSADNTLRLWGVSADELDLSNDEVGLFVSWAKSFEQKCQELEAITAADLANSVLSLIDSKSDWPDEIHLTGFTELPPTHATLLKALENKTKLVWHKAEDQKAIAKRIAINSPEEEIRSMARWAKAQSQTKRIACIIPNLSQIQSTVMRIFIEVFCPERILPGSPQSDLPFNMSAGVALSDFDIIKTAMSIINLNKHHLPQETVRSILLSPYVNHDTVNRSFAAFIEAQLRKDKKALYNHKKIEKTFEEYQHLFPESDLATRWQQLITMTTPTKAHPSDWIIFFQKRLKAIGYPGQKTLSSLEYQVSARWQQALYELAELDFITGPIDLKQACDVLNQLLHSIVFQPQNKATNIQVMGLLEAIGSEFDAAWVCGLDDEAWPPAANPNPFLPLDLQREKHMPHASADRELIYSQDCQAQLLSANDELIFTHAENKDDKHCQASRLIADYTEIKLADCQLANELNLMQQVFNNKNIESFVDHHALAIQNDEIVKGGTWILQQQALCPFRAFASIRLNASSLDEPDVGINAADRGTLLHNVLAHIWTELKTQENLNNNIDPIIQRAIEKECRQSDLFYSVEKERLYKVVSEWLAFEKERPAFTVSECESSHQFSIGELQFNCRIDRVDTLENGAKIIIDYKTGSQNKISNWQGSRPEQPQLPLYCAFSDETLGLCYAQVKRGSMQFIGFAADEDVQTYFPDLKNIQKSDVSWTEQIKQWQKTLTELSDDFYHGVATVDPLHQLACQYCDLSALCRITNRGASEATANNHTHPFTPTLSISKGSQ